MQPVDMLYILASVLGAVLLFLLLFLLRGGVKKKGYILKEKAIRSGCIADGLLQSSNMMPAGWDEYNHRFDKAYYRAVYAYQVNGRSYQYRLSLMYSPKDCIMIYYDPRRPNRAVTDMDIEWKMGTKYRAWVLLPLLFCAVIYIVLKSLF